MFAHGNAHGLGFEKHLGSHLAGHHTITSVASTCWVSHTKIAHEGMSKVAPASTQTLDQFVNACRNSAVLLDPFPSQSFLFGSIENFVFGVSILNDPGLAKQVLNRIAQANHSHLVHLSLTLHVGIPVRLLHSSSMYFLPAVIFATTQLATFAVVRLAAKNCSATIFGSLHRICCSVCVCARARFKESLEPKRA